jgi:D-alanyl-D-alanine carboxypeptidase (penicillin-binding protein 5/6)
VTRALIAALATALALLAALPAAGAAATAGSSSSAPPRISARSAILVQPDTGEIVYRRDATERRPMASTTKLMTALLTLESGDLDRTVRAVPYDASPAESLMGLHAGDRITVRDLMRGLLLASGNDAAMTLAVRIGGSERAFVRRMNARARRLGLTDTHYANPIGLDDPRNYSSAEDLVKLALVLLRDRFFARTVDRSHATVVAGGRRITLTNRNLLVDEVPWVDGVKTGHTNTAGYILVAAARRHGVRVVSAVLGEPSEDARDDDSLALLRWGLGRYRSSTPVRRGEVLARPKLAYREERTRLVAARTVHAVVRRGRAATVRVRAPAQLQGPLARGQRVGSVIVSRAGRRLATVPLVTAGPVAAATLGDRVSSALPPAWVIVLAVVALVAAACSLPLARRRRRRSRRRQARARRRGGTEAA